MSNETDDIRRTYDESPYTSVAFPQCAPEHLAGVARLFGYSAPAPRRARVLELGCAGGGNLIPFAARNPEGSALGIDLSPVQIGDAIDKATRLGLGNIRFLQADLSTLPEDIGQFDYIVCHGLYSWIPADVREAMMRLCHRHLSADGIVYVSYNTYPGWKPREVLRDAMTYHTRGIDDPARKLQRAMDIAAMLTRSATKGSVLAAVMDEMNPVIHSGRDYYVTHEFLEPSNTPVYFHDFIAHADAHGLAYLAESECASMFITNLGREIAEPALREYGGDQVQLEQFMDYLTNRGFRQTLLLREENRHHLRYQLDDDRLRSLHYAVYLPCMEPRLLLDASMQRFGTSTRNINLSSAVVKAAALALTEAWPSTLDFPSLQRATLARLDAVPANAERQILDFLGFTVRRGLGSIKTETMPLAATMPAKPMADAAARHYAALHPPHSAYTFNLWHEWLPLSPFDQAFVQLLDGTRDRAALVRDMKAIVDEGRLSISRSGKPVPEVERQQTISTFVDDALGRLRAMKLVAA